MRRSIARFALHAALCVGLLSAARVSHAQQAAPQQATPDPLRERAQQSLVLPSISLGTGLALILAAPVASIAILVSWADATSEDASLEREANARAIGVGVGMALVGSALTAWGIASVIRIRSARRRLLHMESPGLAAGPGAAQLTLRFRY
jgi:hypothetical protein